MDQVYFCPVCGSVTHDNVLVGSELEKNVDFVEQICREQEEITELFGISLMIGRNSEDRVDVYPKQFENNTSTTILSSTKRNMRRASGNTLSGLNATKPA